MEPTVISRGGQYVPGFGVGDPPRPSECACKKVLGIGDLTVPVAAAAAASPWTLAFVSSVVGAATGWVIEEVARTALGHRRIRR